MNVKCQVCVGAGKWERDTGKIVLQDLRDMTADQRKWVVKCMFCNGQGFHQSIPKPTGY